MKYHLLLIIGRDEKSVSNRFSPEAGNSAAADRPERYPRRQPIMDWEKRGRSGDVPPFHPLGKTHRSEMLNLIWGDFPQMIVRLHGLAI